MLFANSKLQRAFCGKDPAVAGGRPFGASDGDCHYAASHAAVGQPVGYSSDSRPVPKYERKLACQCGIPFYKVKSLLSTYAPRAR